MSRRMLVALGLVVGLSAVIMFWANQNNEQPEAGREREIAQVENPFDPHQKPAEKELGESKSQKSENSKQKSGPEKDPETGRVLFTVADLNEAGHQRLKKAMPNAEVSPETTLRSLTDRVMFLRDHLNEEAKRRVSPGMPADEPVTSDENPPQRVFVAPFPTPSKE